jgi:hypothetical protein
MESSMLYVKRALGPREPSFPSRPDALDCRTSRGYDIFVAQDHAMSLDSPVPQLRKIHWQAEERCESIANLPTPRPSSHERDTMIILQLRDHPKGSWPSGPAALPDSLHL